MFLNSSSTQSLVIVAYVVLSTLPLSSSFVFCTNIMSETAEMHRIFFLLYTCSGYVKTAFLHILVKTPKYKRIPGDFVT